MCLYFVRKCASGVGVGDSVGVDVGDGLGDGFGFGLGVGDSADIVMNIIVIAHGSHSVRVLPTSLTHLVHVQ